MLKTPRRRNEPSRLLSLSRKRTLHLNPETVRTLTADELPLAIGGSCPTTSWPSATTNQGIDGGTC